jgi:hypothetical protein
MPHVMHTVCIVQPTARGASSDVLEHDDVGHSAAASASGAARSGTLLPCPRLIPGQQFLSFDIEKIGLKDAETYVDPYFTISVYGALWCVLCTVRCGVSSVRGVVLCLVYGALCCVSCTVRCVVSSVRCVVVCLAVLAAYPRRCTLCTDTHMVPWGT